MFGRKFGQMYWSFVLFSLLAVVVESVNHQDFKTCDQSSFCERNRNLQPGDSKWEMEASSVQQTGDHLGVEATIKNTDNGAQLKLTLNALLDSGSILKLHINELKSERVRFDAKDALKESVPKTRLEIEKIGLQSFEVKFGKENVNYRAHVYYKPFKIEVFSGKDLLLVGNERGLFNFEHFRKKDSLSEQQLKEQV